MASVALRYAKALADVVLAKHQAGLIQAELQSFSALLFESRELLNVLTNPAVAVEEKRRLLRAIGQRAGYSITTQNFLSVLADHHRLNMYGDILSAVQRELDGRLGIESVQVTTAAPLTEEQKKVLADRLRDFTKKEVRLQFQTDPRLIGGLVAKIGSTIYDGSIREQLQQVRQQLSGD